MRSSKPLASPPGNSTCGLSPGSGVGLPRTIATTAGSFLIAFKERSITAVGKNSDP